MSEHRVMVIGCPVCRGCGIHYGNGEDCSTCTGAGRIEVQVLRPVWGRG